MSPPAELTASTTAAEDDRLLLAVRRYLSMRGENVNRDQMDYERLVELVAGYDGKHDDEIYELAERIIHGGVSPVLYTAYAHVARALVLHNNESVSRDENAAQTPMCVVTNLKMAITLCHGILTTFEGVKLLVIASIVHMQVLLAEDPGNAAHAATNLRAALAAIDTSPALDDTTRRALTNQVHETAREFELTL